MLLVASAFISDPTNDGDQFQNNLVLSLSEILKELWDYQNRLNEPEFFEEFNLFLNRHGIIVFCLRVILNRRHSEEASRNLTLLLHRNIMIDD